MDNRKLEFVLAQLASYSGVKKVINSGSTFVACPFHTEKTPSGRIWHGPKTRDPGNFKCYGCGIIKSWDELAPALGLQPYKWTKPIPMFSQNAMTPLEDIEELSFDFRDLPHDKVWRSINTNLLIDIGCKGIVQYGTKFIWMPVTIREEVRGYIRARLHKEKDKPSYLNKPGSWSKTEGLFPYDYSVAMMKKQKRSTLVLVEGPRDALRLLGHNIPAIAVLGTQSWSEQKSRNLELSGASCIIMMMDGDDAGAKAEELIGPSLEKMFQVKTFDLRGDDSPYCKYQDEPNPSKAARVDGVELWDPGNCPISKLKELKSLLKELK